MIKEKNIEIENTENTEEAQMRSRGRYNQKTIIKKIRYPCTVHCTVHKTAIVIKGNDRFRQIVRTTSQEEEQKRRQRVGKRQRERAQHTHVIS